MTDQFEDIEMELFSICFCLFCFRLFVDNYTVTKHSCRDSLLTIDDVLHQTSETRKVLTI